MSRMTFIIILTIIGNSGLTQSAKYFTSENREAVQAISYGFESWYEDENELPGGVVVIKPSNDESGITDHDNIQNAVDEMSKAGGGKVQLEAGKYFVNNQIMMKSNVILRGAGMNKTVVRNTRTGGVDGASWNVVMLGLHHPMFMTRGLVDIYHKVKFGSVKAGDKQFTLLDSVYDDPVFTKRDNKKYWSKHKPAVGDMVLLTDYDHGRTGPNVPKPATHHWGQFARITGINDYNVTIDEPFVSDLKQGIVHWIPEDPPVHERANLPYWWVENAVVADMEFENTSALIYAYVGTRNSLVENIKAVKMREPRRGFQIQGLYKSTIRGCYVEYAGGRSVEIKSCSGRSLLKNNTFVNVGNNSPRPAIALGESVYAIHIHDNEWHYKVSPHPDTWTFCMPEQYGGSFKRNYIHFDEGVKYPDQASMFQIRGGCPSVTYMDTPYQFCRNTGYMVWEDNRYDVTIGRTYDFFSTNINKTHRYWMRGALINGDDWTGSKITNYAAARIRNGFPARPEDVVVVEHVKNLIGQEASWDSEEPASTFPRIVADEDNPAELISTTIQSNFTNIRINDPWVRYDGMILKKNKNAYRWNEQTKLWINIDNPDDKKPFWFVLD